MKAGGCAVKAVHVIRGQAAAASLLAVAYLMTVQDNKTY